MLNYIVILVYSAEFIALVARLVILFNGSALEKYQNLDRFVKIIFIISITIVLGLLIPLLLRYYFFFARLKLLQLKSEQNFTCKTANFLILPLLGCIFYFALCFVLISEIILQFSNKNNKLILEMAEYRKSSLILVLSFNATGILFLMYCVGKN